MTAASRPRLSGSFDATRPGQAARARVLTAVLVAGVLALTLSLGCGGHAATGPDADDSAPPAHDAAAPPGDAPPGTADAAPAPDAPPAPVRCLSATGACAYAFSMGRLTVNTPAQNDEFVQIGFYRLTPTETATACSHTGPKATKLYWHWGPGHRPDGTCASDYVSPSRWDHAGPDVVDGCPTAASWEPPSAVLRGDCPPHMTAGFGRSAAMITFAGNYDYDRAAGTVTFRFLDLAGHCKKEYWHVRRVVSDGPETELVSLELDGARTGDTSTSWKGTGGTHGFAFGSASPTTSFVPQDVVAGRYASATPFATADHSIHENVLEFGSNDSQGGWQRCGGAPNVLFQYSCHAHDADTSPDLVACNTPNPDGSDSGGAYLKYIADAFPSDTRYNVWYSFHALLTQGTGCYHYGLHSYPLIQVIGSSGTFRGWVGIEYQEAGDGDMSANLYHVVRRVEEGYF